MSALVLDASAAIEVVGHTAKGQAALQHMRGRRLYVPDHFYVETTATIRRMLLVEKAINAARADQLNTRVLVLDTVRVGVRPLVPHAWALRDNLTIADALYIVTARSLDAPVLTGDSKLKNAPIVNDQEIILI